MIKITADLGDKELAQRLRELEKVQDYEEQYLPLANRAWFDSTQRLLMIQLNNQMVLGVPVDLCQEFSKLSDTELTEVQVGPGGYTIFFEASGAGSEISSLLAGRFGSRKWMEKMREQHGIPLGLWPDSEALRSEWGKAAGSARSEAKSKAARVNGKKGGRPRKSPPVPVEVVSKPHTVRKAAKTKPMA